MVGYEEYYLVNQFGDILSLRTNKLRKPVLNKSNGYLYVVLCGKIKITAPIHRIVASAFLKNEHNFNVVNHKDENKKNNCVDNLEWCTSKYNANYGSRTQKMKDKKETKPVFMISKDGEILKRFNSLGDAAREVGVDISAIIRVCKGKQKTSMGYKWTYAE